ncbi:MAG: hypothetical protein CMB31_05260 [Euryarchaeota archaeon]|nr:hypothetical protein [Euryarchaeota archaeon]
MPDCSVCGAFNAAHWELCPECVWKGINTKRLDELIFDQGECVYCECQIDYTSMMNINSKCSSGKKEKKIKKKCCKKHLKKKGKMCKRCPKRFDDDLINTNNENIYNQIL